MGMKMDRGVIELARDKLSVEQIAATLKTKPHTVFKTGRRLGIYFPPLELKRNGRRVTKRTGNSLLIDPTPNLKPQRAS
jgi:hypothetical protein